MFCAIFRETMPLGPIFSASFLDLVCDEMSSPRVQEHVIGDWLWGKEDEISSRVGYCGVLARALTSKYGMYTTFISYIIHNNDMPKNSRFSVPDPPS